MAFADLYTNALSHLAAIPVTQLVFYCAFFFLLASLGGVINAFIDASNGFVARKNLLGKLACQASQSVILSFFLYAVFLGGLSVLHGMANSAVLMTPYLAEMAPFPIVVGVSVLFLALLWSKFPASLITYAFTFFTGIPLLIQLGWWLLLDYAPLKPLQTDIFLPAVAQSLLATFNATTHGDFLIVTLYMILSACVIGSLMMMLWLIIRRNRDDFGRDYYTFAMRRMSRRSLVFLLFSTAVASYANWQLYASMLESFFASYGLLLAVHALLLILIASMLIAVSASATPMRCKPAAVCALFLYIFAFFIQLIIINFSPALA